jgi:putative hemolysin
MLAMNRKKRHRSRRPSETEGPSSQPRTGVRWIWGVVVGMVLVGATQALLARPNARLTVSSLPAVTAPRPSQMLIALFIAFLLILVNGLFAMAEYALIMVRKTRLHQLADEGLRSAQLALKMTSGEQLTRLMATIQIGVTVVATLSSGLAASSTVEPLAAWLRAHLPTMFTLYAGTIALLVVTLPVAVLTLVIGEVAPKSLGLQYAERIALVAVYPLSWLQTLLVPAVSLLTALSNLVLKPFGGTASFSPPAINEEEIKLLVEASEKQGVLEAEETEMIESILDFGDTPVRKVMTPRIDITAFEIGGSLSELVRLIGESGHSRIPIYEGDMDNIIGIVHAKDLLGLAVSTEAGEADIRRIMRPAYFIPETKKIGELLSEFRRSRQQIAIVRDEYGVTSGLVTIEDLLEEIVGDIQDEYDTEEPMVTEIDNRTYLLDGRMSLEDINERFELHLPEEEADTIGGFVFALLGRQAQAGEEVVYEDIRFCVEATDGRRITKVKMELPMPHQAEQEEVDDEQAVVSDKTQEEKPSGLER